MAEKVNKVDQFLKIEPKSELYFKGPYNEIVTEYLTLNNLSDSRICFKIKTTAPKRYCVRPNCGIIDPKNTTKIAVMLQPLGSDNSQIAEFKNKHKFMVQTMLIPEGEINQENLWKEVDPSLIMESKLKCVFDNPLSETTEITENNTTSISGQYSSTKSSEDTGIGGSELLSNKDKMEEDPLVHENQRLKDEVKNLFQELMKAKEEGLRKRLVKQPGSSTELNEPKLKVEMKSNSQILAFGIVLFILGILFGKIYF